MKMIVRNVAEEVVPPELFSQRGTLKTGKPHLVRGLKNVRLRDVEKAPGVIHLKKRYNQVILRAVHQKRP